MEQKFNTGLLVHHHDIETYANGLLPWMKPVFHHVRMLLLTFPEITEKMRYRTPFYDCAGKMMLYLCSFEKTHFVLGFCRGKIMPDTLNILQHKNKQTHVRHLEFKQHNEINEEVLIVYIQNAILLNQHKFGAK